MSCRSTTSLWLSARFRVTLDAVLRDGGGASVAWHTEYLREQLAKHPAEGYKTWDERVAELDAERKKGGDQ